MSDEQSPKPPEPQPDGCPCGHPLNDAYRCLNSRIYGPCSSEDCDGVCDDTWGNCTSDNCACQEGS